MTLPRIPNIHSFFYKPVDEAEHFFSASLLLPTLFILGFGCFFILNQPPLELTNYKLTYLVFMLNVCTMAFSICCSTSKWLKTPELKDQKAMNMGIVLNTLTLIISLAMFTAATTLAGKSVLFMLTAIVIAVMLSHYAYKGSQILIENVCLNKWENRRRQYLQWRLGKVFQVYQNLNPKMDEQELQIYNNTCNSEDINHLEMTLKRFEHMVEKSRASK